MVYVSKIGMDFFSFRLFASTQILIYKFPTKQNFLWSFLLSSLFLSLSLEPVKPNSFVCAGESSRCVSCTNVQPKLKVAFPSVQLYVSVFFSELQTADHSCVSWDVAMLCVCVCRSRFSTQLLTIHFKFTCSGFSVFIMCASCHLRPFMEWREKKASFFPNVKVIDEWEKITRRWEKIDNRIFYLYGITHVLFPSLQHRFSIYHRGIFFDLPAFILPPLTTLFSILGISTRLLNQYMYLSALSNCYGVTWRAPVP